MRKETPSTAVRSPKRRTSPSTTRTSAGGASTSWVITARGLASLLTSPPRGLVRPPPAATCSHGRGGGRSDTPQNFGPVTPCSPGGSSDTGVAAVDEVVAAGDEGRLVGEQEAHQVGDLLRAAEPAE